MPVERRLQRGNILRRFLSMLFNAGRTCLAFLYIIALTWTAPVRWLAVRIARAALWPIRGADTKSAEPKPSGELPRNGTQLSRGIHPTISGRMPETVGGYITLPNGDVCAYSGSSSGGGLSQTAAANRPVGTQQPYAVSDALLYDILRISPPTEEYRRRENLLTRDEVCRLLHIPDTEYPMPRFGFDWDRWFLHADDSLRHAVRYETERAERLLITRREDSRIVTVWGTPISNNMVSAAYQIGLYNYMSQAAALVELCRVCTERREANMEAIAQRQQIESARESIKVQPRHSDSDGIHPLMRLLKAYIDVRGMVFTSPAILELVDHSLDIRRFMDTLRMACVILSGKPSLNFQDFAFTLNFHRRADVAFQAITSTVRQPINLSLVLWQDNDAEWFCRHNSVGATVHRVVTAANPQQTSSDEVNLVRDPSVLVGKPTRAIQLD